MALVRGFVRARTIYIMLTAMRMLVIQHDFALPLGPIDERFADHRYDITPHPGGRENFILSDFPDFSDFDAILPIGAPVYDHLQIGRWRWPRSNTRAPADGGGDPVLGICFGGQLLAPARGSAWLKSPPCAATSSTA
jgi:hypothetical protein